MSLTILSVCYRNVDWLDANHEITSEVSEFEKWLVVNNGGDEIDASRYHVLKGVPKPNVEKHGGVTAVSHHHGLAVNSALPKVRTRFLLIIDPDFFVVPSHQEVLSYMLANGLSFFGAPYFPRPQIKRPILDFPVVFCMYVDLYRVQSFRASDFEPPMDFGDIKKDTGHKVYSEYRSHPNECAQAVQSSESSPEVYDWRDRRFGFHYRAKAHVNSRRRKLIPSAAKTIRAERQTAQEASK